MIKKINIPLVIAFLIFPALTFAHGFIEDKKKLEPYLNRTDCILVASSGRSGSSILTATVINYATNYIVIKTHLLPPDKSFTGKILFIYSNPDKAAESILHRMLDQPPLWGFRHFRHMESSDQSWLEKIEDPTKQTEEHNLLEFDALGYYRQLNDWLLLKTHKSFTTPFESKILAIKYENLWDAETINAIKEFFGIDVFILPPKRKRGYQENELFPIEIACRNLYNRGTWENPIYSAYDEARLLWSSMPPFQFLMLKD